jgi:hypothetical protein
MEMTWPFQNQIDYFMDASKNRAAQNKIDKLTEAAQEIMKNTDAEECEIILSKARQFTDSNCHYLEYWAKEFLIKVAESRLNVLREASI